MCLLYNYPIQQYIYLFQGSKLISTSVVDESGEVGAGDAGMRYKTKVKHFQTSSCEIVLSLLDS